jgi:hypothetical protein
VAATASPADRAVHERSWSAIGRAVDAEPASAAERLLGRVLPSHVVRLIAAAPASGGSGGRPAPASCCWRWSPSTTSPGTSPPRPPSRGSGCSCCAPGTLLAAAGTALVLAGLTVVLPAAVDSQLTALAVLVLAVGLGAVADDDTAALTAATPVTTRRRLLARLVPAVLGTAGALAVVVLLAAAGGAEPGWGLVRLWAVLGALALAAGAIGSRAGVPGAVPATLLLGTGLVLSASLPESLLDAPWWNSTGERLVLGLGVAAVALAWASRRRGGAAAVGGGGRQGQALARTTTSSSSGCSVPMSGSSNRSVRPPRDTDSTMSVS